MHTFWKGRVYPASCGACRTFVLSRTTNSAPSGLCPVADSKDPGSPHVVPVRFARELFLYARGIYSRGRPTCKGNAPKIHEVMRAEPPLLIRQPLLVVLALCSDENSGYYDSRACKGSEGRLDSQSAATSCCTTTFTLQQVTSHQRSSFHCLVDETSVTKVARDQPGPRDDCSRKVAAAVLRNAVEGLDDRHPLAAGIKVLEIDHHRMSTRENDKRFGN